MTDTDAEAHLRVEVRLPDGRPAVRHYSLTSSPAERCRYRIAVIRERASANASFELHYSARTPEHMAFREEVERRAGARAGPLKQGPGQFPQPNRQPPGGEIS